MPLAPAPVAPPCSSSLRSERPLSSSRSSHVPSAARAIFLAFVVPRGGWQGGREGRREGGKRCPRALCLVGRNQSWNVGRGGVYARVVTVMFPTIRGSLLGVPPPPPRPPRVADKAELSVREGTTPGTRRWRCRRFPAIGRIASAGSRVSSASPESPKSWDWEGGEGGPVNNHRNSAIPEGAASLHAAEQIIASLRIYTNTRRPR